MLLWNKEKLDISKVVRLYGGHMKLIIIFFLISLEIISIQYTPRTYQEELNYIRLKNKKWRGIKW